LSEQKQAIPTKQHRFNQDALTETEIYDQLINYTEEACRIDEALKQFELQMQSIASKTRNNEEIVQEKSNKKVKTCRKSQHEPQEFKTTKRAQHRVHNGKIELEEAREAKARRLV
jgi:hypothetical protein